MKYFEFRKIFEYLNISNFQRVKKKNLVSWLDVIISLVWISKFLFR